MTLSLTDIIYEPPTEPSMICFAELFGNARPVELEIGTGKGRFLLEQARQHEDRNYLGIEWARQYWLYAADRMARWGLRNVRLLRTDAGIFVPQAVPTASLAAVHVYHPDPWPKRRHQKRRLFSKTFVEVLSRVLEDGADLEIQTDHAPYFEQICELLSGHDQFEEEYRACYTGADDDAGVATNFQVKYRREGRSIHRLVCRRRDRTVA